MYDSGRRYVCIPRGITGAGARRLAIEVYDTLESTMDTPPPRFPGVTIALEQTRGRGRRGNTWTSPRGGAWLTIHLPGPPPQAAPSLLPVALGGCLAEALEQLPGVEPGAIKVKWPNDLYTARGKLAGILVETAGDTLRVGIGVNVYNQAPPGAARLADHGYRGPLALVYLAVTEAVLTSLEQPHRGLQAARERDMLRGLHVVLETPTGRLAGVARGVTDTGALALETSEGIVEAYCCTVLTWRRLPG
ncbi:biotin--[acetyl-CoA-carboxylase] ligase [Pyrodictium abyssi]|uniref:Biotin--[acetyl-CoA-carboxylase] ligase n=1 Tax=Pyrodictium abyssi TaxID=54256 RepID=A0ABN6ZSK6_9CREN|nr:biotin--[acetyl-CoA-carboxylase] ligase [Pyrodictium abyssi]